MSERPSLAWVRDRLVPRDQATVSIDDFAVRYGAACFETMLARNGMVFRLEPHLARLAYGLRAMGAEPPSGDLLRRAIDETLRANALSDASLRLEVSVGAGHTPDLDAATEPLVTLTVGPLTLPPDPPRLRITSVRLDEHQPMRGAKTANFLTYLLARREARGSGADDALLLNHAGDVAEAATSNVFLLLRDVLVTPAAEAGPISGITRAAVIDVARAIGIPVEERRVTLHDLTRAEAVLLTNSIVGILPVASVEGERPFSPEAVDWRPVSTLPSAVARLSAEYEALVADECGLARRGDTA
ncbi:MAG: hypothetical protein EPO65_07540 [Dehalococcoidia bacterium]|nr:MAG: hypothetical protein EPO65_07540 [Dehalococcoidia bacterium]